MYVVWHREVIGTSSGRVSRASVSFVYESIQYFFLVNRKNPFVNIKMGLTYPGLFHTLLSLYYARNSEDYDNLLLPFTRIWRFSGVIVNLFKISRNLTHQGRTKLLGFFPRGSRKLIIKRKRATNQTKRMRSHRLNQKFSAFIARVKSK